MSFLFIDNEIPNKNEIKKGWFPHQRKLIRIVEKYPVTYAPIPTNIPSKEYKSKMMIAWEEIALILNMPSKTCKQLWIKIKLKYAKLMILINTGILSKEVVIAHPETSKFLDGNLSFLDPHISTITAEDIPYHIHKYINNIFGLVTLRGQNILSRYNTKFFSHEQVKTVLQNRRKNQEDDTCGLDMEYMQNVVEKAIRHKLEELQKNNPPSVNITSDAVNNILDEDDENTVNVTVIPSKNIENQYLRKTKNVTLFPSNNIQNEDKGNTSDRINLGLESELIIEDNIKMENEDEENLTLRNNVNNTIVENDALRHILPDTMNNTIINDSAMDITDNTDHITTTDSNAHTVISDDYIRKFFKELGEVMSMELTSEKQEMLKLRINALVKNILEVQ